ncbi:MAG: TonB-dependent receptor [Burkholderiales bacterium]|nr:MAG: TonB-dependent receptor [Burkholderiales bacterium]
MTTRSHFRLKPLTALLATLAAGSSLAQDLSPPVAEAQALGAVTVRSRNRIEKLQDVPLSISVVQGAELERLGTTGIADITKRAANITWNQGNQRTSSISIRGIGKIGQTEAQDPSVGVIVDGVSYAYNALTSSFDFIDIDTIEVSRGPQGTLLGKNTSVGNIIFNTRRPSFTPSADYSLSFRQGDGVLAYAALGGGIVDNLLAWRGTFSVNRGNGDIKNQYNKDITYTNTDRVSGRVQFLLTPRDDLKLLARFDVQPLAGEATNGRNYNYDTPDTYDSGYKVDKSNTTYAKLARRWFSDVKSYNADAYNNTVNNDSARPLVTGSHGASLTADWDIGSHTITSITAYKDYHFNAYNDEGTPFDISRNAGGYWNDYKQVSQELRLSSKVGGFVDYQAGLYFIHVNNDSTYNIGFGNDAGAWYASPSQYTALDADGAGRYLLQSSLANLKLASNATTGHQVIDNKSAALFGQANWRIDDRLTLTTGARVTRENRNNLGSTVVLDNGSAAELSPSSFNGITLGGFDAYFNPSAATRYVLNGNVVTASTPGAVAVAAGTVALTTDATNAAGAQLQADYAAKKYFGAANFAALTLAQKKQLFYAQQIRKARLGVLFNPTPAQPYKATQPTVTLSPSYKFTPDITGYFSFQYGEKAGIAQFYNGVSVPVKAEKTNNFELGVKSALLNRTLILNADIFLTKIRDYQQAVRAYDDYTTGQNVAAGITPSVAYASINGNVPKVKVSGLEVDGVYAGIPNTTIRFSGAYNRAVYEQFTNAAYPAEQGDLVTAANPYKDLSGSVMPGAPKLTGNLGVDYQLPVWGDKVFHASANIAVSSGFYSDTALSRYSWIGKSAIVDASVGLGKLNKTFDVSLIVKNLFNDDTPLSKSWSSVTPAIPRNVGIQFTGRL